jgi:hypothetical protein
MRDENYYPEFWLGSSYLRFALLELNWLSYNLDNNFVWLRWKFSPVNQQMMHSSGFVKLRDNRLAV